jgi:hypothetical protein
MPIIHRLFIALAAIQQAFAKANYKVDAFVCGNRNQPLARQGLSHGRLIRICIRPSAGFSIRGLHSFRFEQSDSFSQVVIHEGGEVDDAEITEASCTEELCILQSHLVGDFFLSGDMQVYGKGVVITEEITSSDDERDNHNEKMQLENVIVTVKVKTNPVALSFKIYSDKCSKAEDTAAPRVVS